MHVRGLQRDHEPGGQAAQTVDVQETPQQDVQGQVQEEEKRPGPELRWGRRGWQLRKRQTGGKCRQHTLHCKTKNGILWRSTCKTYPFRTSVKSKKTVITKKSRSGAVFTETAAAIKSASFGTKTTAVSRNIGVRKFIKKIYTFFILL